ncbi:Fur family transcriptional regulator [uncultured Limosilactobacillus sp.]|uniref:Fur family transcriptional regulator n=1 Tax=uncultured Limosilactobacillus sp. TaxID=2837629 RepID=UPI0025DF6131|nr:Fur family transcriptional regulator [uncultured Limosilactobacillus sp.]
MTESLTFAKQRIKQRGLRWTKQRESLVRILEASLDRYVDITEVDRRMRKQYPNISHDTIYRNLQEFKELKLVETKPGTNGLMVKLECDPHHHHHFICQNCGKVQEIKMVNFDYADYQKQLPGAKITGHSFELYGYCAECQRRMNEKS